TGPAAQVRPGTPWRGRLGRDDRSACGRWLPRMLGAPAARAAIDIGEYTYGTRIEFRRGQMLPDCDARFSITFVGDLVTARDEIRQLWLEIFGGGGRSLPYVRTPIEYVRKANHVVARQDLFGCLVREKRQRLLLQLAGQSGVDIWSGDDLQRILEGIGVLN